MIMFNKLDKSKPILVAGPTASGKSALALDLADRFDGMIINADALQVYGCWRVLTARPDPAEEARAPHHLYGHVACDGDYSVGVWLREVGALLQRAQKLPIIVGGTGLYFAALTEGLVDIPPIPAEIRARSQGLLDGEGLLRLLADLALEDAKTLARIDQNNPMRVQRAWEVLQATGRGLAAWQADTPEPLLPRQDTNALVLDAPKDWLTPRIDRRFDLMLEQGALDECRANLAGWQPDHPSARAIGAAELMAHLRGEMPLDQAIDLAKIATRQYAKRQRSWFRARMKDWTAVDLSTRLSG
jgi:tRNA dimethylallyltransferase